MAKTTFRGDWAIQDTRLIPVSEVDFYEEGTVVYEVLRLDEGIPLFIEDHFSRFCNSAEKMGYSLQISLSELKHQLEKLASKNGFIEGNVFLKIKLHPTVQNTLWHFIPHVYPGQDQYQKGVSLKLLHAERPNPEAKVLNLSVRQQANHIIEESGCYEVLLVDREGFITEGSRSNFMLFKGNEVYTAPGDKILSGITLKKVINICEQNGIILHRIGAREAELEQFDAACLTGTSPKVLPVSSIENYPFAADHPLMRKLIQLYDLEVEQYKKKRLSD